MSQIVFRLFAGGFAHTRGKRLLQLLGLVLVLEDEGVQVTVAADLELDLLGGGLLDTGSCCFQKSVLASIFVISALQGKRTGSVLAAADLDELLDIGDLGRHVGGVVRRVVCVTGQRDVVGGSCFCGMRR